MLPIQTPINSPRITWNDIFYDGFNTAALNWTNLYQLETSYVATLFRTPDNEAVPFDRHDFFTWLVSEIGDFEPVTENVERLYSRVASWSGTRLHYWQRMYDTLCADYEPLWNYNRFDDEQTDTDRNKDATSESLDKVAGYDSGALVDNESMTGTGNETEKTGQTVARHSYGNIGVMSSQDLVKQELEVCQISMYEIIRDEFKSEMCILVY